MKRAHSIDPPDTRYLKQRAFIPATHQRHLPGFDPLWEGDPVPPGRVWHTNDGSADSHISALPPPHPRDADVRFDDSLRPDGTRKHDYYVKDKRYPGSVTGFIESLFPPFEEDEISESIATRSFRTGHKYEGLKAKGLRELWKKAADDGTDMHENYERFYIGKPYYVDTVEAKMFLSWFWDYPELVPIASEMRVYEEDLLWIGTIDMVVAIWVRGVGWVIVLYDWKRSLLIFRDFGEKGTAAATMNRPNTKYEHYYTQLHIYAAIFRRKYGIEIVEANLMVTHPTQTRYLRVKFDISRDYMNELVAHRMRQLLGLIPMPPHSLPKDVPRADMAVPRWMERNPDKFWETIQYAA